MSTVDCDSPPADSGELVPAGNRGGFVTQPRDRGLAPALLAEQQRAKSEIEAALTIAQARPRDQKAALDRIVTACQRPGVASNSQYQYARGGTDIIGPNIRLMEVIAQNWGNIEWGFRELARFPGHNGQPGESVVEAVAWDLETNSRVRKQLTVSHSERTKKGLKTFTDPRDIYEWIANQAQRRVRTCLENIIPRDIQDAACEECDATMKAKIKIGPDTIKQLLERFAGIGVNREQLEARIQRRLEAITPAQIIALGKVFSSVKDGLARAEDFFEFAPKAPEKSTADKAKDALRKPKPAPAPEAPAEEPPFNPPSPADAAGWTDPTPEEQAAAQSQAEPSRFDVWLQRIAVIDSKGGCVKALTDAGRDPDLSADERRKLVAAINERQKAIHGSRGERSNGN